MDEIAKEYDVVVLGTGLTECILSGYADAEAEKWPGLSKAEIQRQANTRFF